MIRDPDRIARLFHAACLAELDALKPGNVHRHGGSPRHGLTVEDFARSAAAAAPALARPAPGLGARILAAIRATRAVVETNTNLGIVLLCAPLAEAALGRRPGEPLREAVVRVLATATPVDTAHLYEAIRIAAPGGLGRRPRYDVTETPPVPPRTVMAEAEDFDRIARNWTRGLGDVFDLGLPTLHALGHRGPAGDLLLTGLHLALLARIPDTLIRRRHGTRAAAAVRRCAERLWPRFLRDPEGTQPALVALDRALARRRWNPGTTADLVVATLFARTLVDDGAPRCQTPRPVQGRGQPADTP